MGHSEEFFKNFIMAFHRLRIMGFMSDKEEKCIWKRISKTITEAGYTFEDVGFYEYEFKKIEKQEEI